MLDQTAPGLVRWENLEHKGRKYVKISEQPGARPVPNPRQDRLALYYAPTGRSILVTPNEDLIRRFFERQERTADNPSAATPNERPSSDSKTEPRLTWLGRNLALRINENGMRLVNGMSLESHGVLLRRQAYNALPILNEWHRLFPDRDPVQLHETLWGERLSCPAGGKFVWDENWGTMKSTVLGHPGEPFPALKIPGPFSDLGRAEFGINFEDGGLRGRLEVEVNQPR
jgi:hypothetical protein